jgi:hypothetical protein
MKNELNINISNSSYISITDVNQTNTSANPQAIKELIDIISKLENEISNQSDVQKQKQLSDLKNDLKKPNSSEKIKSFLLSSGKWILDFAKSVGKDVLVAYINK